VQSTEFSVGPLATGCACVVKGARPRGGWEPPPV